MGKRFHGLKVVAVSLIVGLSIGAAAALADTNFSDPAGNVKGGAGPDLTSISVSHTASAVTFRLRFAKAPPLGVSVRERWVDMLVIGIDVPPRQGLRGWVDYFVGLHGTEKTAMLVTNPVTKPGRGKVVARPKVAVAGRTLSFSVSRNTLGDPKTWIEFSVAAGREMADQTIGGGGDMAPNHGAFHYRLGK